MCLAQGPQPSEAGEALIRGLSLSSQLLYHCRPCLIYIGMPGIPYVLGYMKVSKEAKIRNRYNEVPHLTQDTNGKVTNSQ